MAAASVATGAPASAGRCAAAGAEAGGEDRSEDRDADRAADRAEERGAGGGDAEVAVVDGVLHREDEDLHHHAEAEAEDEHVAGHHPGRRRGAEGGEQPEAQGHNRGAGDREEAVAAEAADELAAGDRGEEHAAHHRGELQAGARRRDVLHHLEVDRHVGDEPNIATPTMKPTAEARTKVRLAKSAGGRIGSGAWISTRTKPASAASETAARPRRARARPRAGCGRRGSPPAPAR